MKLSLGLVIGFCLPFLAAYVFIISGMMPVATNSKPLPLERYLAGRAIGAAIHHSVIQEPPIEATVDNLKAGGQIYQQQCAFCHGLPNQQEGMAGKGMFPHPPQFLVPRPGPHHHGPVGITYWVVSNGIRSTGMPGFQNELTPQQIWQVSLFLHNPNPAYLPAH